MKRFALLLTSTIVLVFASYAWADGAGTGAAMTNKPATPTSTIYVQMMDKIVGLTEDQKKKMDEIGEACDKSMKEFRAENDEKIKAATVALQKAYQGKNQDKDAVAKALKEYQEAYAPITEIVKKSQANLWNVLTDDQKVKWIMNAAQKSVAPVQLSDGQIKELKKAAADLVKESSIQQQNLVKVHEKVQDLLTDEQKAAIAKFQVMSLITFHFRQAQMTPEQTKQAEAACDELAKTLKGKELQDKLFEKINALLTDKQKEAMKKAPAGSNRLRAGIGGMH